MISPPEAKVLHHCLISQRDGPEVFPQEDITVQRFRGDHIDACLDTDGISESAFDELLVSSILTRQEYEYCESCGCAADLCTAPSHDYNSRTEFSIQSSEVINEWSSWLADSTDLEQFEIIENESARWALTGVLDDETVRFQVFFSAEELREHDFEPERLEFGIGFFDREFLPNEDYLFSWTEPLESTNGSQQDFDTRLRSVINTYKEAISARFVDTDQISEFQREVRGGIWTFLDSNGFTPYREITEHLTAHRGKYGIEPIGDDFVAVREDSDEEVILVCRCSKGSDSYHLHRFVDEEIRSAESEQEYQHLLDHIEERIDTFLKIRNRMSTSTSLTNILLAVASLASLAIVSDSFFNITNLFGEYLPEGALIPIWIKLALVLGNVLAVIIISAIIVIPHIKAHYFKWDIPALDESGQ